MMQDAEVPVFKHDSIATIDESKLVELLLVSLCTSNPGTGKLLASFQLSWKTTRNAPRRNSSSIAS